MNQDKGKFKLYKKSILPVQINFVYERADNFFAPMLYINELAPAIEFYKNAFDAIELRRWEHDGRVHVAEMTIGGALFHMHEEVTRNNELSPQTLKGTCVAIGLFVEDPNAVMAKTVAPGGTEIDPVQDYDFEYRQGSLADPFGHHWLIEKRIG